MRNCPRHPDCPRARPWLPRTLLGLLVGATLGFGPAAAARDAATPAERVTALVATDAAKHTFVTGRAIGHFDQAPKARVQVAAPYPASLLASGVKGRAVVTLMVDRDGSTSGFSVVASRREFAVAAQLSAEKWRFEPARSAEKPTACRVELVYEFPGPMVSGTIDLRDDTWRPARLGI